MILHGFKNYEIAKAIPCTPRAVRRARSTHARYGTTTVPLKRTGPDPKISPTMQVALCHRLANESDMDRYEMIDFISEKFEEEVSVTSITRALDKHKMTFKYRLKTLGCRSYHLVFIDEPGFNKPCVSRRKGWAPKGITPVQKARFQRGARLQLLAAYTQKGVKLSCFSYGSVDKPIFEYFIEQLLRHCGKWPELETVLIMDNVSFHNSDRIRQMCEDAGVKSDFLALYTLRANPIEEFFGEVKTHVKS
ncbi:hypothetical protein G7Y89_g9127 [Cudoniella acicularis]|uniref:Tc1-like transposase DDE domain-containing protein n=1 Tax=Cudoniella acicularis TaxID=354080 RepID=A0A8H4W2W7_9HELO|nr:hypothetical protein G7Y89_g9127 [Cudoniella acicularis]